MDVRFLLFICLAFVPLAQAAPSAQEVPSVHIGFDLNAETYNDLTSKLRGLLLRPSVPPFDPRHVSGRYVLGPRRPNFRGSPLGWIMIDVVGEAPEDKATLAIANDDLYLLGFRNCTGSWYILGGSFSGLPDAITLPSTESYYDLVGGHKNLRNVPLGKQSAIEAVKILASYDPARTTEGQMKQAMVRFVVMITEAMRFRKIRDTFSAQKWQSQTYITEDQAKYVVHWGQLSSLLVNWNRRLSWRGKDAEAVRDDIGVNGPVDALNIVDFLVRPLGR